MGQWFERTTTTSVERIFAYPRAPFAHISGGVCVCAYVRACVCACVRERV